MKILIVADPHLHTWSSFNLNKASELSRRLQEQDDILSQICNLAEDRKVDSVEILGDIFHKVGEIPVLCLNIFDTFLTTLDDLEIPYHITTGNHDLVVRDNPEWYHSATQLFDKCDDEVYGQLKIKRVGYSEHLDYDQVKGYDLVFLHKTPYGSKYGNYTFDEGVDWKTLSENNRLVFFGHIHERQELSKNCIVVGSPMHLTFGDVGERGVYIVDTDTWSIEFIKLKYPEFRNVESLSEVQDSYNYYKVKNVRGQVSTVSNVISVSVPDFFDERLKSDSFDGILKEWLQLNQKDETYLELIKDLAVEKFKLAKQVFQGVLASVKVKDFMSIDKATYQVRKGFILVKGRNESFSSNGAGKTSLFEAIFWGLFGETTKGLTGDDVIRRGQKDCVVELTLINDKGMYLVRRSRKAGLSIVIPADADDDVVLGLRKTDQQTLLEEKILGFDKNVFLASCYFSQENLVMLTGMSDTEKTNTITSLLGFEVYDDLYDGVFDRMKDFEKDIVDRKVDVEFQEKLVIQHKTELEGLERMVQEKQDEIKYYQNRIIEVQNNIVTYKQALQKVETIETIDYDAILKELYDMEQIFNNQKDSIDEFISNLDQKDFQTKTRQRELQAIRGQYKINIVSLQREITALEELKFGERCDKCGAIISEANAEIFKHDKAKEIEDIIEVKIKDMDSEFSGLEVTKMSIDRARVDLDEKRKSVFEKLNKVRNDTRESLTEKLVYQAKVQDISSRRGDLEYKLRDCDKSISDYSGRIEEIDEKIKKLWDEKDIKQKALGDVEKRITELNWMIDKTQKGIEALDFWKVAFSPKGIRVLLLDRFCNEINSIVNNYLASISNGSMSLVIKPTSILKSGEERNKLGLDILLGGVVVKYESLSGGEKRRVDVALCLGLNEYISKRFNLKNGLLGFLILDEIFSYLDSSGEESIGSLLYQEGLKKAIFVISHTDELTNYAADTWTVSKVNGVSTLELTH